MEKPADSINLDQIISELQSSFDDDRFGFLDVAFEDGTDQATEMAAWRDEMAEMWKKLVLHTMEVWDFGFHHTYDSPCSKRSEWLFRRKESPLKNCSVEDCRRVVHFALANKRGEPEQFMYFLLAVLTQGQNMWPWSECKSENEMQPIEEAAKRDRREEGAVPPDSIE